MNDNHDPSNGEFSSGGAGGYRASRGKVNPAKDKLWDDMQDKSKRLKALSGGGPMGLTPDHVKATVEWKKAKGDYEAALTKYRNYKESDMETNYFYTVDATKELVVEGAYCASDSHDGLRQKLSSAIDGKVQAGADMGQGDQSKERANSNYPMHYVQQVHDKHVIYSNGGKTFAHKYEKDGDGDPHLKGNPQEVEHSFTPITKTKESFAESTAFDVQPGKAELLCESFGDKGEINFTVIKPGWSKNNRYYSADLLKSRANIFEGAKMFVNHATDKESASRPEGDLNNWVANITKVWAEGDGTVKATAKVIDPAFKAKLSLLGESKMLNTMGVSIRAMGESKPGEAEGRKGNVVESLLAARSVDFVTFAGAGGEVESLN